MVFLTKTAANMGGERQRHGKTKTKKEKDMHKDKGTNHHQRVTADKICQGKDKDKDRNIDKDKYK